MLNFQLTTDKDRQEAALIERRRAMEEERKKRIFNPRERLFGNDYEQLQKQIEEKRQKRSQDALIERIFDEQRIKNDEIALALEKKEKEERIRLEKEINYFRMCCQRPEDRREFDINDPDLMKKQVPPRSSQPDTCGPSSAQKFEGEDLAAEERTRAQKEQAKAWLDQQMKEKLAADKDRKAAEEAFRMAVIARDERAVLLDSMERNCRKKLEEASLRFNKALADERKMEEIKRLKREHEDSMAEMYNFMTSDLLTENPDVSKSNLGPTRRIGFMYKGMTPEEREQVRKYQLLQIEEGKKRKELDARREREFDDYINGIQRTICLMDREQDRKQRVLSKQLAEENRKMAEEQKSRKLFMDKVVFTNRPTAEFYDQFNKSTR